MDTRAGFGGVVFSLMTCTALAHGQAVQREPAAQRVTLEGVVLAPDGAPAEGAVVTSSAGGRAVTDVAGGYCLEVQLPLEATGVQVTAKRTAGTSLVASASVALSAGTGRTRLAPLGLSRRTACSPSWVPTFGGHPGFTAGAVRAIAAYDDGSGQALYVGGGFRTASGVVAGRIAKWDGVSWSALGAGIDETQDSDDDPIVNALAVFDDGSGSALYAAG